MVAGNELFFSRAKKERFRPISSGNTLSANCRFLDARPMWVIVVYDNWMTVGSAILDMRVITWEILM